MGTVNQLPFLLQLPMFIDHPTITSPSNQHKLHHLLLERTASHKINLLPLHNGRKDWQKENVRGFELQQSVF
jgi:hypothetical protein